MRYLIVIVLLVAVILTAGCFSQNKNSVTRNPTPTVPQYVTTIPQMTGVATLSQTYKNADILFGRNPDYGFKMDYPSEWTYEKEDNNAWYLGKESKRYSPGCGRSSGYNSGYNFLSPDKKSQVFVVFANRYDLVDCLVPLDEWVDSCAVTMKINPYCHDGAGNRIDCSPTQKYYYHMNLISNETVILSGNVVARKLVFTSYEDENAGWDTFYLMYAGKIQGFNYTIPNRREYLEEVNGPVWDCGKGGLGYAIHLYTSKDQVNITSDIFNHMIKSFQITSP